jgi:hypothetical protein
MAKKEKKVEEKVLVALQNSADYDLVVELVDEKIQLDPRGVMYAKEDIANVLLDMYAELTVI